MRLFTILLLPQLYQHLLISCRISKFILSWFTLHLQLTIAIKSCLAISFYELWIQLINSLKKKKRTSMSSSGRMKWIVLIAINANDCQSSFTFSQSDFWTKFCRCLKPFDHHDVDVRFISVFYLKIIVLWRSFTLQWYCRH